MCVQSSNASPYYMKNKKCTLLQRTKYHIGKCTKIQSTEYLDLSERKINCKIFTNY